LQTVKQRRYTNPTDTQQFLYTAEKQNSKNST